MISANITQSPQNSSSETLSLDLREAKEDRHSIPGSPAFLQGMVEGGHPRSRLVPVSLKASTDPPIYIHPGQCSRVTAQKITLVTGEGTGTPTAKSQSSCSPKYLWVVIDRQHSHSSFYCWKTTASLDY